MGSLVDALRWIEVTITGQAATAIAVIVFAGLGFAMMRGRMPKERAMVAVLGCFVIFSAGMIASGILGAVRLATPLSVSPDLPLVYLPVSPRPTSPDPFPGASLPDQRTKDVFR